MENINSVPIIYCQRDRFKVEEHIEEYTSQAMRVIVLMKDDVVLAYICLRDELRDDAKDTLNFFKKQGVDIKLISGDDPKQLKL